MSRRAPTSSPRHAHQNSAKSSHRSSSSSIGQHSIHSNFSSKSTPRSSLGNGSILFDLPEAPPEGEEHTHSHYCTHSEHPKPIGTCDAWKRHEREHEVVYRCMPFGAIENTAAGPECAFCGARNPDQGHLQKHNATACPGGSRKPLTSSRRSNLVKHLTLHSIFGEEASALADKWRYWSNKKAFSCGFCIKVFSTLADRSSHIDNEHWKHGKDMSEWSLTNVISGLLQQPELKEIWQGYLASDPPLCESSFTWELPQAEGLQLKLELGEDSPTELANLAYHLSNDGFMLPCQNSEAVNAITALEQMDLDPYQWHPPEPAQMPVTNSSQNVTYRNAQCHTLIPKSPLLPSWSNLSPTRSDSLDWTFNQPHRVSALPGPSSALDLSWDDSGDQSGRILDTCDRILHSHRSPRSHSSTTAAAMDPDLHLDYHHFSQDPSTLVGSTPCHQLMSPSQGYADSFPGREKQQQQYDSSSYLLECPNNGIVPISRPADGRSAGSFGPSSGRQSSQKPLPPLPDAQQAQYGEAGERSNMELDF